MLHFPRMQVISHHTKILFKQFTYDIKSLKGFSISPTCIHILTFKQWLIRIQVVFHLKPKQFKSDEIHILCLRIQPIIVKFDDVIVF